MSHVADIHGGAGHGGGHDGAHGGGHGVDDWHHHEAGVVPQVESGAVIKPGIIFGWFVALVIAIVLFVAATWMYFNFYVSRFRAEREEQVSDVRGEYAEYAAQSMGTLKGSAGWIDGEKGIVKLPLDRAKEKVIAKYKSGAFATPAAATSTAPVAGGGGGGSGGGTPQ